MKWMVQIAGDELDLKELSKSLMDEDLRVREKEGQYFLESTRFDKLSTAQEVSLLTLEILSMLTGATRLFLSGRTPIRLVNIAKVRPDGGKDIFVSVSEAVHGRETVNMEIIHADGTKAVIHPANKIPGWIKLGLTDSSVSKALRLLGTNEVDWVNLYRLYEVIENDVGGIDTIVNNDWATKTSIRRFKHTANSPGAVGDASRHGKESTAPPTDPMDIAEARALLETILHNWLRSKTLL